MKVLLAGLLHFASTLLGPDPSFPKPTIERVRIVGDTVWFEGTRGFDSVGVRYCFVRHSGSWCRLPGSDVTVSEPMPRSPRDSIALAPGLRLVCRPSDSWPSSCDAFGVLSSAEHRVHWLIPQATRATRDALQRAIGLETDDLPEMSTFVTTYAIDDRSLWFGIGGGFPEGDGAFGGLMRFDRQTRTIETITHPKLANASVTGLVADGDALWIGTIHPGEHGPWGSTGILRRDLRTGGWSQLDSANTELPDDLIRAIAVADGTLYVATEDGLAAYEAKSGRWNVRYFRRTMVADSVVYTLAPTPAVDDAADEMVFIVMEMLHVKRRGAFVAAMREIGLGVKRNVAPHGLSPVAALAHRPLIPFLLEALAVPDAASLAAAALVRIGDPQVVPSLRQAMSRALASDSVVFASALAQLGDSATLGWLHSRLLSGSSLRDRHSALMVLHQVRDRRSIEPMLAALADNAAAHDLRRSAVLALRDYQLPSVWQRMVVTARSAPAMRPILVDLADTIALEDSTVAAALGEWALTLLDTASREPTPRPAVRIAALVRPADAVPAIMRRFAADERWADAAAPALVILTGIDTAPAVRPVRDEGRRLAWEFWTAWWRTNATSYEVVERTVGERAYRRWMNRIIARERLQYKRRTRQRG